MPAASWPRCWSACRPSATIAAASGWPKMPKTPHSSRSRSASKSRFENGSWGIIALKMRSRLAGAKMKISSILLGGRGCPSLAVDDRLDLLFRGGVWSDVRLLLRRRGGRRRGGSRGSRRRRRRRHGLVGRRSRRRSLIVRLVGRGHAGLTGFQPVLDRVLGVFRQHGDHAIGGGGQDRAGLGVLDPLRLLLFRDQPIENGESDDRQQEAARNPEHETERAVERADLAV